MAGCYHDQEDFQPDMKIEIAKEDEIVKEGYDLDDIDCEKNPRHYDFIPFKDLRLEDLPENKRTMKNLNVIKRMGTIVVRIVVDKMENGKWIKICGTGCLEVIQQLYCIKTNNHVVKTNEDVKNCTVEFFYDSHDRSKVIRTKGLELYETCPYKDLTYFVIHPVHDSIKQLDIFDNDSIVSYIVLFDKNNKVITRGSHPRLWKSAVVHYTDIDINDPDIEIMFIWHWDKYVGHLKSSYFRFQPILFNIQDITNIEIHVDEDDDNSTVISGKVVKFGDEYVVKISKFIFQDKVKKCRLVWNGEVISSGTRLYFEQIKSDKNMEQITKNYWLFDCSQKPKNTYLDTTDSNLCCIGHPHGGIKMVTFGMFWGFSDEHFDKKGRHIIQPREDCLCKKTVCFNYSCKTCSGSSGSIVFSLDGFENTRRLTHFMGRRIDVLPNMQYIDNINTAWLSY